MGHQKMRWDQLLCEERQGHEQHPDETRQERSQFERDFDRIIFSESLRRLKDKTQVFPVTDNDHVHNRLTHSLEVSCIGRSLGRIVGDKIIKKYRDGHLKELIEKGLNEASFGALVQTACLAHDIGNPPFGHSGENAIQSWFYSETGKQHLETMSEGEKEDLEWFEGNAQGFRILTTSERQTKRKSLQLTFATLATFTKYPRESLVKDKDLLKNQERESVKYEESKRNKYGFFQSEKEIFKEVAEKTGLIPLGNNDTAWWCRHPLAFLVEAADDICYRIMDLEDGFNMGYIDYQMTKELLLNIAGSKYEKDLKNGNSQSERREDIRFLRGKAINKLIDVSTNTFIENEEGLLTGEFDKPLLHTVEDKIKEIKKEIKAKVYNCQEVLSIEIAGYDVISALLDEFMTAINDDISSRDPRNKKGEKVNKLLSESFFEGQLGSRRYLNALKVIDYIAGMTDSYAVTLFRQIKGISLPRR
ncbi:deoxyguanosinetriphosphate triphosphohydrolase [Microcoleus sp. FACHB-53]|nr:deoxyguanosinetriphosphate triphosphohydrolase [Microcoleus sp. FACHB-53]